ncbi:TPR-like protein [Dendrothele bispora CBS 962.96]|uniref:TPR-like protein n=1 Tax=Dendrothele bispora (strain CBS 962.96) TaxID=1314807 RepID=A0A4S8LZZ4_DENBC|nr:TPR-like protein [Dendrothele bispora CBS 962.96]
MTETAITALWEPGLKNRNREKTIQEHRHIDIATGSASSGLNTQTHEEQMQTSCSPHFFRDLQNNNFTKAMITNVAGNQIIKYDSVPSPDIKKITADMIASVTPALSSVFEGREELVKQGINILCEQALRFLAILGAGGMGKTSLAFHIMKSDLVQTKFAGRCYFVPCELFEDAESLVLGLIYVMELTMQENQSKHKVLFDHLQVAYGDLLIVFDNFETPWNHADSRIGVKNLLEKIAKCGKVSLIVTMRGLNGPGDIPWEKLGDEFGIPTLAPVSAKEAFKAFAGNKLQSSDNSESQIDSFLHQLEYVPLAIRLSAQHLKRIPLKALIRMWEKDKTSILTEGTVPGRLTSDEGLKMLAPVREHVHSKYPIGQTDTDHLDTFYSGFLENLPEDVMQAQPILQYHINNVEKIFKAQISSQLRWMGRFPGCQGPGYVSKKSLNEKGNTSQSEANILGKCFDILQDIYYAQAQYGKAIDMNLQAQKYFEQSEDQWAQASSKLSNYFNKLKMTWELQSVCKGLEISMECKNRNEEAIDIYQMLKKISDFRKSTASGRVSIESWGDYRMQRKYNKASEMTLKAQKQFKQIGYKQGLADCLWTLGRVYRNQTQYDEAIDMFSNAHRQYQGIGRIVNVAQCFEHLGITYRLKGQYPKAKDAFTEALELLKRFPGEKYSIGYTLLQFGHLFFDCKDFAEARKKYEKARDLFDSHGELEKEVDECSKRLAKLDEAEAAASIGCIL